MLLKKIKFKIKFFVFIFLIFCFWKFYKNHLIKRGYSKNDYNFEWISEQPKNGPIKKILLWTNYYSASWLPRLNGFENNKNCPNLCNFIDDKSKVSVEILIFLKQCELEFPKNCQKIFFS